MEQVYIEQRGSEHEHPYRILEVGAFETDSSDPELLPALIHLHFWDRDHPLLSGDQWFIHDGLRGARIIRKAIQVFDKAAATHFPNEEGAE